MKFKDPFLHRYAEINQSEIIPSMIEIVIFDEILKSLGVGIRLDIQDLRDYLNSLNYTGKE